MRRVPALMGAGLGVLGLLALLAMFLGPPYVEARLNVVEPLDAPPVSERARRLHDDLLAVDLHDDLLLWGRDPLVRGERGHTDLPRWREGRIGLQVLAAVTKTPLGMNFERTRADALDMITPLAVLQRWPIATWRSLHARALYIASRFDDAVARSDGALRAIRTRRDLDALVRARDAGEPVVGVLLASEGMHPLEGDEAKLSSLFDAGYRMLAPTHFFDNALAGSAHGMRKGGLTQLGQRVIDLTQERSIAIDLAHASPQVIDDVLDRVHGPVVVSHTGVQGTCAGPRNLSDAHLRRIAAGGGIVGIALFEGAICGVDPSSAARAMRYSADLVGAEHVALGSDWDGATTVQIDPSRLVHLTEAMLREGFTDDEVRAILGGNALRVLRELLPE